MQGKGLPRLFLPQTPLTWELPALGLSFFLLDSARKVAPICENILQIDFI